MAFRNLYLKEMRSSLPLLGVFSAAALLLHLFLLYKHASLDEDTVFALAMALPFVVAGLLALGTAYYQLHIEWKTNAVYLLLSLPVRGWKVSAAKLTAVVSLYVLCLAALGASFSLILLRVRWEDIRSSGELAPLFPDMLNITLHFLWMSGLVVAFLTAAIQFAFLCGQLAARFRWLIALGAFAGIVWLVLRVSPLPAGWLGWLPDIVFGGAESDVVYLQAGPFLVLLLAAAGLVWLNGYIFERETEV